MTKLAQGDKAPDFGVKRQKVGLKIGFFVAVIVESRCL